MADRTAETRNGQDAAEGATAPAASAGGAKAFMPLIITVAIMPVLAFVMTKFVLVPQMTKALGAQTAAVPAEGGSTNSEAGASGSSGSGSGEGHSKVTVPMAKILVNVAGTMGTRYLMTSVTLVGSDENMKDKVDRNKDQLLDLATSTLSTKTISDLEKPGARNVIRAELMTVFNNALGGPIIKEIYITELAIQ